MKWDKNKKFMKQYKINKKNLILLMNKTNIG